MDGLFPFETPPARPVSDLEPLIIDSFAGGGGASTGIELALGRSPDVAINHSESALALHTANHPETDHLMTSIYKVDPRDLVQPGQRVGLAWFSPDCKHFSKAKGGQPLNKNIRDLAWVVVDWAEKIRPEVILLENVEEFTTWGPLRQRHVGGHPTTAGPLTADLWDRAPPDVKGDPVFNDDGTPFMEIDPLRKGQTFTEWVHRLRRAGYKVEWRELRACDYGAPTIRKRLFVVARCDGQPIVWPDPTHADPDSAAVKAGTLKPWRSAAECIDWSLPCPSIFDTKAEVQEKHGLSAVRPLAKSTMARVARGMKRYVLDADRPFIVNLTHGGRVEDAAAPLRTITGANRGEKAVVVPSITRFNSGATGQDMRAPLSTITANSWKKKPGGAAPLGLITPVLTYAQHGGAVRSVEDPHHTICANNKDINGVIIPTLVQTGYGERDGQAPRALDLGKPLGTVVAGGAKHAAVAATLMGCGGRAAQSRPRGMGEPAATITAKADTCIASAFLAQHHTGVTGHDARAPVSTISATGSHQMPVAAWFAKYYGTGDGARTDEPCHTITVKDRMAHMQADLSAPPFAPEHEARAREVADFMRAHGAWDDREFVTVEIEAATFVVIDIGMRMLTPRELFRAQGFPDDYVIEGVWTEDAEGEWHWKPFTKNVQVSCCGNSVSPPPAKALVQANCGHLAVRAEAAA